jgi:hypothetical protein
MRVNRAHDSCASIANIITCHLHPQLTRLALVELQRDYPDILTQLLINLTRILSTKLRKTNKLTLVRS